MKFSIKSISNNNVDAIEFTETNPPEWLVSYEYHWFWVKYILTLDVGKSINTDFHKITRVQ